jgi:hypothetical protein
LIILSQEPFISINEDNILYKIYLQYYPGAPVILEKFTVYSVQDEKEKHIDSLMTFSYRVAYIKFLFTKEKLMKT